MLPARLHLLPAISRPCFSGHTHPVTCINRRAIFGLGRWTAGGDEEDIIDYEKARKEEKDEEKERKEVERKLAEIRARGVLKFKKPYRPPPPESLQKQLIQALESSVDEFDAKDWRKVDLAGNPHLKFKLLTMLESRLGHSVPNSLLHDMRTAGDLAAYYSRRVDNVGPYAALAKKHVEGGKGEGEDDGRPVNLNLIEEWKQFHPEDVDEYHGGQTAFPGRDLKQRTLRKKRLYREFRAKKYWYDYLDPTFDHKVGAPADAPWLKGAARKYTELRNLGPKKFL